MPFPNQTVTLARGVVDGVRGAVAQNLGFFHLVGSTDKKRLRAIADLLRDHSFDDADDIRLISQKRRCVPSAVENLRNAIRRRRVALQHADVLDDTGLDRALIVDGREEVAEADDQVENLRIARIIHDLILPQLDARRRRIVWECAVEGRTLEELSREFGISRERVRQIREQTYGAIRRKFGEMEGEWERCARSDQDPRTKRP